MANVHRTLVALVVLGVVVSEVHRLVEADACDDQYLLPTDQPSPSSILSVAAINGILAEHNKARRNVNPMAKVMPMLKWNQTLADFAQEYVSGCPGMVHSSSTLRSNATRFGWSYIGENLAAGSGNNYLVETGGAASTAAWNAEIKDWTYPNTCASGGVCGHYTQDIWASTTHVGCGYMRCNSLPYLNYWSCNYGPGGNYVGQAPYVSTTDATQASACQNGSLAVTPPPSPPTTSAPTTAAAGGTTSTPTTTAAGATPAPPTSTTTAATTTTTTTTTTTAVPRASTLPPGAARFPNGVVRASAATCWAIVALGLLLNLMGVAH